MLTKLRIRRLLLISLIGFALSLSYAQPKVEDLTDDGLDNLIQSRVGSKHSQLVHKLNLHLKQLEKYNNQLNKLHQELDAVQSSIKLLNSHLYRYTLQASVAESSSMLAANTSLDKQRKIIYLERLIQAKYHQSIKLNDDIKQLNTRILALKSIIEQINKKLKNNR